MIPFPDVIRIEPSSACNLKCIHCPTGSTKSRNRGVMSEDTFNIILKNIEHKVPRVVVMYHGGEPLLCKNLWAWIRLLKNMGVKYIKTITNGTLAGISDLQQAVTSKLDEFTFSVDGLSVEENDLIRRGSDGAEVISTIKRMIRIKQALHSDSPIIRINNAQFKTQDSPEKPSIPQFLIKEFKDYSGLLDYECIYAVHWGIWEVGNAHPPYVIKDGYCPRLSETITIRWNGDVVPCCLDLMSKYVTGNIHKSSLEEIWNSAKYEMIREGLKNNTPVDFCKGCCQSTTVS